MKAKNEISKFQTQLVSMHNDRINGILRKERTDSWNHEVLIPPEALLPNNT